MHAYVQYKIKNVNDKRVSFLVEIVSINQKVIGSILGLKTFFHINNNIDKIGKSLKFNVITECCDFQLIYRYLQFMAH